MVDLGLSVKWACCNVGATKPEEYCGCYWSPSWNAHNCYDAWNLNFDYDGYYNCYRDYYVRCYGLSVRPVSE